MDGLVIITSFLLLSIVLLCYRYSSGLFSVSFLITAYIVLLYLGALHFYVTQRHLTLIFVVFMALFYLIGILIFNKLFKKRRPSGRPLKIYSPLNTSVLKLSLIIAFLVSLAVSLYRVERFGIPLLARSWYTAGIASTTGVENRLLYCIGPTGLIIIALLSYAMYKAQNKNFFKNLSALSFILYVMFEILQGGKAAAIMPFLLMLMASFYCNRKTPKKLLVVAAISTLFFALFIGFFWTGNFSFYRTFQLYSHRATVDAALHLDYLLYEWAPNHHYLFGGTIWLETKRIIAQIGFLPKEPLYKEMIGNLRVGRPVETVTGISPELSVFGQLGYANFGLLGAIFVAVVLGFFVKWIDLLLYSRRVMNCFSFTLWIYFVYHLLGFVRAGDLVIGLQKWILEVTPILFIIVIVYLSLAMPYPQAMRWKKIGATEWGVNYGG